MQSSGEKKSWESLIPELETLGFKISECRAITLNSILLKARQVLVERDVAIKILRHAVEENDVSYQRFQQEVKLLGAFAQDNIVKLYGAGRLQDGRLYMVMEFVDGLSLAQILEKDGALPESRLLLYLAQVCDALEYAHNEKIVHRDLKPANIMVHKSENEGVIKLVDLGIHKSIAGGDQKLTATGAVMPGTKDYMSPEQCRGEALDQRSDIYALGCVIFELLVGHPPMTAETDYAILFNQLNKEVREVPSKFPISSGLKLVVLRCLEKKSEKRWSNIAEIQEQLKKCRPLPPLSWGSSQGIKVASLALLSVILLGALLVKNFQGGSSKSFSGSNKNSAGNGNTKKLNTQVTGLSRLESLDLAHTSGGDTLGPLIGLCADVKGLPLRLSPQDKRIREALSAALNKLKARFDSKRLKSSTITELARAQIYANEALIEMRLGAINEAEASFAQVREEEALALRLRGSEQDSGQWLALCVDQLCSRYEQEENFEQAIRVLDSYCPSAQPKEELALHHIILANRLRFGRFAKCKQYLSYAVDSYCKNKKFASDDLYEMLTSLLDNLGEAEKTVRLYKSIPISDPAKNQHTATISINYARALLETGNLKDGALLYKKLSTNASFLALADMAQELEYVQLLYAIKSKNEVLKQSCLKQMFGQLQDKSAKFPLPSGFLSSILLADPQLLERLLAHLTAAKVANPVALADSLTEFGNTMRSRNKCAEALSAYKFAHQLYDCDRGYYDGNFTAYAGENLCLQNMGRLKDRVASYAEAEKYMRSRGRNSLVEQPQLFLQQGVLLRDLGEFDKAIDSHSSVLKSLLPRRKEQPGYFAQAALQLLLDYKAAKMRKAAQQTASIYLPLLKENALEDASELKDFERECSGLSN